MVCARQVGVEYALPSLNKITVKYARFDLLGDDVVVRGWFPGDGLIGSDTNDTWNRAKALLAKRCSYVERQFLRLLDSARPRRCRVASHLVSAAYHRSGTY